MAPLRSFLALTPLVLLIGCTEIAPGTCSGSSAPDETGLCRVTCSANDACLLGEVCTGGLCRPAPADLFEIRLFELQPTTIEPNGAIEVRYVVLGADDVELHVETNMGSALVARNLPRPADTYRWENVQESGVLILRARRGQTDILEERRVYVVEDDVKGPEIVSLTATPLQARPGEEVRIAWEVLNATSVNLSYGMVAQPVDPRGVLPVVVEATTTFFLSADSPEGRDEDQVTVTVVGDDDPRFTEFGVTSDDIVEGDTVGIFWETENAQRVEVYQDGAIIYETSNPAVVAKGAYIGAPFEPAQYHAAAFGRSQSAAAITPSEFVQVTPRAVPPVFSFATINPRKLPNMGGTLSAQIRWQTNVPDGTVRLFDFSNGVERVIRNGMTQVQLEGPATRNFKLTVENEAGGDEVFLSVFQPLRESPDPNDDPMFDSLQYATNRVIDGMIDSIGSFWDQDWYLIYLPDTGVIQADLGAMCAMGMEIELFTESAISLGSAQSGANGCASLYKDGLTAGTYRIVVRMPPGMTPGGDVMLPYELFVMGEATAVCGNGLPEYGEHCDDGNRTAYDGCTGRCYAENGWIYDVQINANPGLPIDGERIEFESQNGLPLDDGYRVWPLPFQFPFYGSQHGAIVIHTNGYIGFLEDAVHNTSFAPLGPQLPNAVIAPFGMDLELRPQAAVPSTVEVVEGIQGADDAVLIVWRNMRVLGAQGLLTGGVLLQADGTHAIAYGNLTGGVGQLFDAGTEGRNGVNVLPVPGCEVGCNLMSPLDQNAFTFTPVAVAVPGGEGG